MENTRQAVLPTAGPAIEMIKGLFGLAETMLSENKITLEDVPGIGIRCGGHLDSRNGIIPSPPNLPGWDRIEIVKLAKARFGKQCLIQNNANACAVAEWKHGAGKGVRTSFF